MRAAWQNATAERWIGSCRCEFLDHIYCLERASSSPSASGLRARWGRNIVGPRPFGSKFSRSTACCRAPFSLLINPASAIGRASNAGGTPSPFTFQREHMSTNAPTVVGVQSARQPHKTSPFQQPMSPTTYLGGPSGVWVKSKQSDILSAEPSRWLIDGTPKFSSQNLRMLTKECGVFEI